MCVCVCVNPTKTCGSILLRVYYTRNKCFRFSSFSGFLSPFQTGPNFLTRHLITGAASADPASGNVAGYHDHQIHTRLETTDSMIMLIILIHYRVQHVYDHGSAYHGITQQSTWAHQRWWMIMRRVHRRRLEHWSLPAPRSRGMNRANQISIDGITVKLRGVRRDAGYCVTSLTVWITAGRIGISSGHLAINAT